MIMAFSCRKDEVISAEKLNLRFSTDTVYLDTVFQTIGSSTYVLKVFNDENETVRIPSIRLENPASPFRVNINGTPARSLNNVEILPKDSIYIFVEVSAAEIMNGQEMLVTDKLLFAGNNQEQSVDLVTLAKDAIFHPPTNFIVIGNGPGAVVIPYSVINCNETWDASRPHVIYGYAVIDSGCVLTINPGTDVHFHKNSGMWVFDDAQLKVAENAFPGSGDSVTFSSDRLEPNFEDAPGQWGGVLGGLYIGQRAKAKLNNLVIKNATTGLRADSAVFQDQLSITNSYILNSSRTAFYAGYSNVKAYNLVVANSGLYCLYAFGGNYEFRHSTFANYWSGSTRQEPAVLLTNYLEIQDEQGSIERIVRDLENAYFGNCILYGSNEQELSLAEDEGGAFNYRFNNVLLKLAPDAEDRGFSLAPPEFNNAFVNTIPGFKKPSLNNYALDSLSQAVNQGNVTDGFMVPSDILGRNRNFNSIPDLGAFERQF